MTNSNESDVPEYLTAHATRLSQNVTRVDSLIDLHGFLDRLAEGVEDRRPEVNDVLRVVTVLLHASLEDFIRSIAAENLSMANADLLANIPLVGIDNPGPKKGTQLFFSKRAASPFSPFPGLFEPMLAIVSIRIRLRAVPLESILRCRPGLERVLKEKDGY